MAIIYQPVKRTRKSNAQTRELDDAWENLKAAHAKPLERGCINRGTKAPKLNNKQKRAAKRAAAAEPTIPHSTSFGTATVPVNDPLAEAKRNLASRVGQSFNKGGLQYLTDDEMAEQRTGAHKRR